MDLRRGPLMRDIIESFNTHTLYDLIVVSASMVMIIFKVSFHFLAISCAMSVVLWFRYADRLGRIRTLVSGSLNMEYNSSDVADVQMIEGILSKVNFLVVLQAPVFFACLVCCPPFAPGFAVWLVYSSMVLLLRTYIGPEFWLKRRKFQAAVRATEINKERAAFIVEVHANLEQQ